MMQKTRFTKLLSLLLCTVLIAAMALTAAGCGKEEKPDADVVTIADGSVIGEGATEFALTVVDGEGKETKCTVKTDKTVVGEALQELNLIAGDMGDYGLYIKTVNGITADFDKDGTYWAFYIDGEYAMTGVDKTNITPGASYMFKVEK